MARISWTVWALLEPALYTGHHLTLVIKTPPTWIRPSPFVSQHPGALAGLHFSSKLLTCPSNPTVLHSEIC